MAMSVPQEYDHMDVLGTWFEWEHLPEPQRTIAKACHELAVKALTELPHNDEAYIGLRKLLEAKDCFVRATIVEQGLHSWISQSRWKKGVIAEVP